MSEELDAELAELLEAGRLEALPPGGREAVRAGVSRRLLRPYVIAAGAGVVAALALLLASGAPDPNETRAPVEAPAPRVESSAAPVEAPAPPEPREALPTETAPLEPAPIPATPPRRGAARSRPVVATPEPVSEPAPASSTLQEEVALLRRAHGALERRQPREAIAALDEHAERFPEGVLRLDREATSWVARCELDPTSRAAGRAFAARHPRAPLAARLRQACAVDGENP